MECCNCRFGNHYLELSGIRAYGRHGVLPFEKKQKQPFSVDLTVWLDSDKCCTTDDVADTLDYSILSNKVADIIENTSFNLIETLADKIARSILTMSHVAG